MPPQHADEQGMGTGLEAQPTLGLLPRVWGSQVLLRGGPRHAEVQLPELECPQPCGCMSVCVSVTLCAPVCMCVRCSLRPGAGHYQRNPDPEGCAHARQCHLPS